MRHIINYISHYYSLGSNTVALEKQADGIQQLEDKGSNTMDFIEYVKLQQEIHGTVQVPLDVNIFLVSLYIVDIFDF